VSDAVPETAVEKVTRWEEFGALVRVRHLSDASAILDLCTCTGEPVERMESEDGELIALLRRRPPAEL